MLKNKKGLSGIVTMLIIILLVLVAVGVVWQVVGGLLSDSTNKIASSSKCFDIGLTVDKIVPVAGDDDYNITFRRTSTGSEEKVFVKIMLFDKNDKSSELLDFVNGMGPLERETQEFSDTGVYNATRMEFTPYFMDESGTESLCSMREKRF